MPFLMCVVVAVPLAGALAGCGDDDAHVGTIGGEVRDPQSGGHLTYLATESLDSPDPGRTYRSVGFMVAFAVGRPLFFAPQSADGHIEPDLADGLPRVSADRMTVTVRIRAGIRYAPPIARDVRSADVKYAIERAFSRNVANPYVGRYLSSIHGAPVAGAGPIRAIPGIQTPDDRTIVFRLDRPEANMVVQALALPVSIPVPRAYAARADATVPSTYGSRLRPASTGPYMFSTASTGARLRQQGVALVRNPAWSADSDDRPAYADTIRVRFGRSNRARALRETLDGSGVICCGTTAIPDPLLARATADHPDQVGFIADGGTRSIALNTSRAPFDDVNLRRAVAAALDRTELRRLAGGEATGRIATGWLAPGIPGSVAAGGERQNTDRDYLVNPAGDAAVARRYMDAAADDGLPIRRGTWVGEKPITLVTSGADTTRPVANAVRQQLESLGFTVTVRTVSGAVNQARWCGASGAEVAVCPMTWVPDLIDPQAVFDPQFAAGAIRRSGGTNWSRFDDPEVTAELAAAGRRTMGQGREQAYVALNRQIADAVPAIPWLWGQTAVIHSRDTVSVANRVSGLTDLSYSWVSRP